MLVTRLGVSVLKVVATIEMPMSHRGAGCPDVKNSLVLLLALFQKKSAGRKLTAMLAPMMIQSSVAKWKGPFCTMTGRVLWVSDLRPVYCRREHTVFVHPRSGAAVPRAGVVVARTVAVAGLDP